MSPLSEKLSAILDEWEQMTNSLSSYQQQCAQKDQTIAQMKETVGSQQQQLTRQAAEVTALKSQLTSLHAHVMASLLTAADPDDARIKKRIDAAYAAMASKSATGTGLIASAATGSGSGVSNMTAGPTRPATPNDPPANQPAATLSVPPVRIASPVNGGRPTNGQARVTVPTTPARPQPQPVSISLAK